MLVCLFPIMTLMWLATTACVLATIPKMTVLVALTAAACVTSTDPVLSQAVAKGPFSDKYVARPLREMISAEAGANDGFASPFLMLGVSLMLHREDAAAALRLWVVETWLYTVALAIAYGAVFGFCARKAVELSLARKWIDSESYLLFPTALAASTGAPSQPVYPLDDGANHPASCLLSAPAALWGLATCWPALSPAAC
jgi:sodium/hydrogen antiporter